jgi:hypothetical protein
MFMVISALGCSKYYKKVVIVEEVKPVQIEITGKHSADSKKGDKDADAPKDYQVLITKDVNTNSVE